MESDFARIIRVIKEELDNLMLATNERIEEQTKMYKDANEGWRKTAVRFARCLNAIGYDENIPPENENYEGIKEAREFLDQNGNMR